MSPFSKTNIVYVTNYTSILTVSTNPPVKMVRVDCVWELQVEDCLPIPLSPTGRLTNDLVSGYFKPIQSGIYSRSVIVNAERE